MKLIKLYPLFIIGVSIVTFFLWIFYPFFNSLAYRLILSFGIGMLAGHGISSGRIDYEKAKEIEKDLKEATKRWEKIHLKLEKKYKKYE